MMNLFLKLMKLIKRFQLKKIKGVMENVHLNFKNFEVPLLVDYGFGDNWGDAH